MKTFTAVELPRAVVFDVIRNNNRSDDVCVVFGSRGDLHLYFATAASARQFCADLSTWLEEDDQSRAARRAFAAATPDKSTKTE